MNRHPLFPESARGFTFLEVLIAIVCIGMVVTGLGAAVVAALRYPTLNRETLQATFIAQEAMDWIVADRRQLGTLPPVGGDCSAVLSGFTLLSGFTCAIDPVAGCPATGSCQLTVTVTMPSGGVVTATWVAVR